MIIILNQFRRRFNPETPGDTPSFIYDTEEKKVYKIDSRIIVK